MSQLFELDMLVCRLNLKTTQTTNIHVKKYATVSYEGVAVWNTRQDVIAFKEMKNNWVYPTQNIRIVGYFKMRKIHVFVFFLYCSLIKI